DRVLQIKHDAISRQCARLLDRARIGPRHIEDAAAGAERHGMTYAKNLCSEDIGECNESSGPVGGGLAGYHEPKAPPDDGNLPTAAPLRRLSRLSGWPVADRAEPLSRARRARTGAGNHGGRLLRLAGVARGDLRCEARRAVRGAQRRQPGAALLSGRAL